MTNDQNKEQSEVQSNERSEVQNNEQSEVQNQEQSEVQNQEQSEVQNQEQSEVQNQEQSEVQNQEQSEVQNKEQSEVQNQEQSEVQNQEQSKVQNQEQSEVQNNVKKSAEKATAIDFMVSPYEMKVEKFDFVEKINEHTFVELYGCIDAYKVEEYTQKIAEDAIIMISIKNKTTFTGIVTKFQINRIKGVYYIKINALSFTYLLDVTKVEGRTFQSKKLDTSEIIWQILKNYNEIVKGYNKLDFSNCLEDGKHFLRLLKEEKQYKNIKEYASGITIQYLETDWKLLTRMASRLNSGILPIRSPRKDFGITVIFNFGIPTNEKGPIPIETTTDYSVTNDLAAYNNAKSYIIGVSKDDFIFYEVESYQDFNIGDKVTFRNKELVIRENSAKLLKGELIYNYVLCPPNGLAQIPIFNEKILGASLNGKIVGVKKNKVQVEFAFDNKIDFNIEIVGENTPEPQEGFVSDGFNANIEEKKTPDPLQHYHFFPYSSLYASEKNIGWNFMPEIGDSVRVYFPSKKEKDGIVIPLDSSELGNVDDCDYNYDDDDEKQFIKKFQKVTQTKSQTKKDKKSKILEPINGKKIILASDHILVTNGSDQIKLHDNKKISILSNGNIEFNANKELVFAAKNILCEAEQEINLIANNNNNILIDNEKIKIKGEKGVIV